MSEITIREATPDDAGAMAEVLNPIIAAGGTTAYQTPRNGDDLCAMIFKHDLICAFVALDAAGEVAGFQWVERDDHDATFGYIASFARIAPKLSGVGTALFAATRDACHAAGLVAIIAKIRADNTGGLAFYSKMGFRDHSVDRAVPLTDGTPVDRISKRFEFGAEG
jgi:L-amino acid N-acyltransferase YncA